MSDDDRAAYREQRRKEAEALLDGLLSQEGWETWLRLRRGLYRYSWRNQVMIATGAWNQAQMVEEGHPDAPAAPCARRPTVVKSASAWKQDGYHPARGSRGLLIWAFRSRRRKDGLWTCCGARLTVGTCPDCMKADGYFRVASVFDASQVRSFETGEAPDVRSPDGAPVTGDTPGRELLPVLAEWALADGIAARVDLEAASDHGEAGSFDRVSRLLRVCRHIGDTMPSDNARLSVAIHESAHALGIMESREDGLTYADAEVAVECVAYIVAGTVGLDTSADAIPYMAHWGGEGSREKVRTLAKLIDAAAKRIEAPLLAVLEGAVA